MTPQNPIGTVLLIEDSRTQAGAIMRSLHGAGYAVEWVRSYADAFEKIEHADAIVADLCTPDQTSCNSTYEIFERNAIAAGKPITIYTAASPARPHITKERQDGHLLAWIREAIGRDLNARYTQGTRSP